MVVVNPYLTKLLKESQSESLSTDQLPFPIFMKRLESISLLPASNMVELRQKNNKKTIGDIFEDFCYIYFLLKKVDNVWTYKNIPDDLKKTLALPVKDMGIDLIIKEGNEYSAVQVKYRKKDKLTNVLSWTELSTFYASCLKTGPWKKHIVFTNCDYIRHVGRKTKKDHGICYGTLKNLTSFDFIDIIKEIQPESNITYNNDNDNDNDVIASDNTETEIKFKSETLEKAKKFLENSKNKFIPIVAVTEIKNPLELNQDIDLKLENHTKVREIKKLISPKTNHNKNGKVDLEELRIKRLNYFSSFK
jgi:hypothetical protein